MVVLYLQIFNPNFYIFFKIPISRKLRKKVNFFLIKHGKLAFENITVWQLLRKLSNVKPPSLNETLIVLICYVLLCIADSLKAVEETCAKFGVIRQVTRGSDGKVIMNKIRQTTSEDL